MDYRTGKCSQCGAEYKVPASFAHNVARCKVCKGVVHLGAPGEAMPPVASKPFSPAMPAKKVVPKPAAPRAARPAVPEAKKTPPSAPARPAAASAPAEPVGERPKGGTLERLKNERRPDGAHAPANTPAKPAPQPVGAGARASAGRGDAEGGSRSRRGERRAPRKEKKAPVGAIVGGIALVVLGAGFFLFKDQILGTGNDAEAASTPVADAPADGAPAQPEAASAAAERELAAADAPPDDAAAAAAAAEVTEPPKPKAKDPASVDLAAIADFEPTPDTSAEEWAQMNEWMTTWMDVEAGAAGNRAKLSLIAEGRKAVPVILNHFKTLDFATPEGRSNGDQCQKALQQISNGTNFDWKYVDEAAGRPVDHPDDVYFCKRVVEEWTKLWRQVEVSIEAWIKIAKLEEKDPEEAARLRETFGGAQPAMEEPAAGSDDDLEVD
jgi:hypothetical protein